MTRFLLPCLFALGLAALGCGGGGDATIPADPTALLDPASDDARAVEVAAEISSLETDAEVTSLEPMMAGSPLEGRAFGDDSGACRTVVGNPREGGSITFDECPTRRGTLSGTITWSGAVPGATEGVTTSTTARDLTYAPGDGNLPIHLVGTAVVTVTIGEGTQSLNRTGSSTATEGERRLENESNLTWTRTRGVRTSMYPVGTSASRFYLGETLITEVLITFDGTSIATGTVNGREFTINLARPAERPRPKRPTDRPSDRPSGR